MDNFKPVEWTGTVIEVRLNPVDTDTWPQLMHGQAVKNRWAAVGAFANSQGNPKLLIAVDGQLVGECPYARLAKNAALVEALESGVNVGVVALRMQFDPEATLFLGREYKYRPAPGGH